MILVVDINKGIQTQTAECLVIGQITCDKMIVVLNKIDLIPESKREHQIEKVGWMGFLCEWINMIQMYVRYGTLVSACV